MHSSPFTQFPVVWNNLQGNSRNNESQGGTSVDKHKQKTLLTYDVILINATLDQVKAADLSYLGSSEGYHACRDSGRLGHRTQ